MAIPLRDVVEDPGMAAQVLENALRGTRVTRITRTNGVVILNLEFEPLPELPDYPTERARIRVYLDGAIEALPRGPRRPWKHRNPSPYGKAYTDLGGSLCLYYPHDPDPLRWSWAEGLEGYVVRVRRHLIYEEAWRRTGEWPVEDAPHGEPAHGVRHIRSDFMRQEVRRWRRQV